MNINKLPFFEYICYLDLFPNILFCILELVLDASSKRNLEYLRPFLAYSCKLRLRVHHDCKIIEFLWPYLVKLFCVCLLWNTYLSFKVLFCCNCYLLCCLHAISIFLVESHRHYLYGRAFNDCDRACDVLAFCLGCFSVVRINNMGHSHLISRKPKQHGLLSVNPCPDSWILASSPLSRPKLHCS